MIFSIQSWVLSWDAMETPSPPPQRMKNRNILMCIKYVLTTLHVNCMILFDKDLKLGQEKMYTWVK
jgi:hypothetical protein